MALAATGVSHAIDSRRTFAHPSRLDASTEKSAAESWRGKLVCGSAPTSRIRSATPPARDQHADGIERRPDQPKGGACRRPLEWAIANAAVGLRHVHIEDGFGPEERDRQIPRRAWLRRVFLRRATVVLPSRTLQRIALETWHLPRQRVHYLPNGVDLGRFRPEAAGPARPGRVASGPVIGTVAALRPEKNLARLLRAFARLPPPVRLVIVGDGPDRPALEALARELGVAAAVNFRGPTDAPELAYRDFDLFALSSDTEQMPLAVLEAMASGLPVTATDVGDVAEMLAPENRPFVVPGDAVALADSLARLVHAPQLCGRLGRANRAKAERDYDERTMLAAYGNLLAGVSAR
jgi:glycosyltransferase involved in cell wall biosynthesis